VTGGAGFIGSHIVDALLSDGHEVVVLDDFSTGDPANVAPAAKVVQGSIVDEETVRSAMAGCELVFHEAALKAVLRSVDHPLPTDHANTHGTLTILQIARETGVRRVVHASSSSVYGGAAATPTPESAPLTPRSPYAVSKLAAEQYCRVFHELYGLETVALRYFNVYGPRQRPDATYAAVIPLFGAALLKGERPIVHGDGSQSRDFTYISDVVAANLAAAAAPVERCGGRVYNIAAGDTWSLLDVLQIFGELLGVTPDPIFDEPRPGDVKVSQANAAAAAADLGVHCRVDLREGLSRAVDWLRTLGR
jgi:UDP-glucose 4-epimerase